MLNKSIYSCSIVWNQKVISFANERERLLIYRSDKREGWVRYESIKNKSNKNGSKIDMTLILNE